VIEEKQDCCRPGVNFIKQFTPYACNLQKFTLIWLHAFAPCSQLPDLGALYALRQAPNFYEIHPSFKNFRLKYFKSNYESYQLAKNECTIQKPKEHSRKNIFQIVAKKN
jgi:hypothetical protein